MTSNRERAAKVIDRLRSKGKGSYLTALELDAAGVLADDLPKPASSGWVVETPLVKKVALGVGGKVALLPQGIEFQETHITPTEARDLALALLAAAAHAQKDNNHE